MKLTFKMWAGVESLGVFYLDIFKSDDGSPSERIGSYHGYSEAECIRIAGDVIEALKYEPVIWEEEI